MPIAPPSLPVRSALSAASDAPLSSGRRSRLVRFGAGLLGVTFALTAQSSVTAAAADELPPRTAYSLSAGISTTSAPLGEAVTIGGTLAPAVAGEKLILRRLTGGVWIDVDSMVTSDTGAYTVSFRRPAPGVFRYRVVKLEDADNRWARAELPALEVFKVHTYSVRTDGNVNLNMNAFRSRVAATYADPRGWVRGHRRFQEVPEGGDFTVVAAEASKLPNYSPICSVKYSCRAGRFVIINQDRYRHGSAAFTGTIAQYRQMVINHETGHWLGSGHEFCTTPGAPAPVMQQQSKGMQGCAPNAWPLQGEVASL